MNTEESKQAPVTRKGEEIEEVQKLLKRVNDILESYPDDLKLRKAKHYLLSIWVYVDQSQPLSQPKEGEEKIYTQSQLNKIVDEATESVTSLKSQLSGYGLVVDFLPVLEENYQAQIAGFYYQDKTDEEKKMRQAVIIEYEDLIAIYKSCKAKASLSSVSGEEKNK